MKGKIISALIVAIVSVGLFVVDFSKKNYSEASEIYQVYLNGTKIGMLADDSELYDLINEKQQEIKEKHGVNKVYPPKDFDIVKTYSYDEMINDVDEIVGPGEVTEITLSELAALVRLQRDAKRHQGNI